MGRSIFAHNPFGFEDIIKYNQEEHQPTFGIDHVSFHSIYVSKEVMERNEV